MSLNRLRLNQTVSGQIPVTISLTEKTRMAENLLWARSHDASTSFESMELLLNPYGITPLTALCMFHTDTRCRLSYTVVSDFCVPWHYDSMTYTTNHVLPVFGLCENTDNIITLTLYDESNQPIKNREITLHTGTLSETNHYPCVQDKQGMYRYFLSLPAKDDNLIPLSDGHFLIVHPDYLVKTEQGLLPTHIYEVDLLGRCYRTYYVGDGIFDVYGEISAENKIKYHAAASLASNHMTAVFFMAQKLFLECGFSMQQANEELYRLAKGNLEKYSRTGMCRFPDRTCGARGQKYRTETYGCIRC